MTQLSVTYDRATLADGYYLDADVNPSPATTAGDLESSLLVATATEDIARFSTLQDLTQYSVGPDLFWFQADSYPVGTPLAGDTLSFLTLPGSWGRLGYSLSHLNFDIVAVEGSVAPFRIRIDSSFPFPSGFTGTVSYKIWRGSWGEEVLIPTESVVRIRRYDPGVSAPLYVRVPRATVLYPSIEAATNKYISLHAQAQSLINASKVKEESFEGSITRVYT